MALCAAAAPAAAAAAPPTRPTGVHARSVARSSLLRAERIVRARHRGPVKVDLTPVLARLSATLPALPPAERRRARRLLLRPTDGAADPQGTGYAVPEAPGSPFCSAHYCIHWVEATPDAPPLTDSQPNGVPDYVESASQVAEQSRSVENGQLGWRTPRSDGTLGGSVGKTDVYLAQLGGTGVYGYTAVDPGQSVTRTDHSAFSYLVVDNDFAPAEYGYPAPIDPLRVTIAHEYNHTLQYTYDALEQTWMFEATAVWAEGKVFPAVRDYLQYLPDWIQLTTIPLTRFNGDDPNDRSSSKVYGSSVWSKWLDARLGAALIRRAWEDSIGTRPQSFAAAAYDRATRQSGGAGFSDAFDRFAAATAEWQARNSGFPEGALYPDVERRHTLSVNGAIDVRRLDHTAYVLERVPLTSRGRIELGASVPRGTAAALALVGRVGGRPGGALTVVLKKLPHGGLGHVVLHRLGRFRRITAVLVNSDFSQRGHSQLFDDFRYRRDRQLYRARVSTDFKAPKARPRSPARGARGVSRRTAVRVRFSERVLGVGGSTFQLVRVGGGRVPARVRIKAGRVATLTPKRPLRRRTRYRVRLVRSISDRAFNPLARPPTWTFRTGR